MNATAFVTGADRGLGLRLTQLLLERGFTVFAGQFMREWTELAHLQTLFPETLAVLPLDVTSDSSVATAAQAITERVDALDVVINNAGLFRDRSGSVSKNLYFDDMMRLYDTNSLGPLRVTHAVLPLLMQGTKKLLINISSESGSVGQCWRDKEYGYSMSKAALNMQSAMLQNHLRPHGVKVLAVHPGWVRSYMLGHFNEEATVEAIDSARGILALMETHASLDAPLYVDYEGKPLPW